MRQIQIENLRKINALILKDKLNRVLIPIKEYSIYKKNSQIKICIKYRNHFSLVTSILFSIKIDGSWFINIKNNKFQYSDHYNIKNIFKEIEKIIIKDIKIPEKKYNRFPLINNKSFNKIILKELNLFKFKDHQRITLIRDHSHCDNHLLIVKKENNIEIAETKSEFKIKIFKNNTIKLEKNKIKLSEILKELECKR